MNAKLNALVHTRWFESAILTMIILSGILAGLETSPALVARHGTLLETLDLVVLAIFLRRIEDLHAGYGVSCWDHLDDLEKAARHYYGEVVASALKTKIIDIFGANRT